MSAQPSQAASPETFGVFDWPTNLSTWSFAAGDGGLPLVFAGASAHQAGAAPSWSRTAMLLCDCSFSV